METKFYEFSQNNTGGSFVTDSKLCHRLIIEASSASEASDIAEDLGCYWDGVEDGSDCPCCGDRWHNYPDAIDLKKINDKWKGYEYSTWVGSNEKPEEALERIKSRYPKSEWFDEPRIEEKYGSQRIIGRMKMNTLEEYAQVTADLYGWTKPDIRIFYKNGDVKEIFKDGED